ncbi:MAG: hypothetical protein K6F14_02535 [Clostridiales bacterium]|nr:hypothetical protein [Clostridiales bacterium]
MKLSLIKKTALIIICIGIVVGVVAIAIYNKGMYDVVIEHYERYSIDVSKLVAVEIDSERLSNVQKVIVDICEPLMKSRVFPASINVNTESCCLI